MRATFRVLTVFVNSATIGKCVQKHTATLVFTRGIHWQTITKNIKYISKEKLNNKTDPKTLKFENPLNRPLCVMPSWLLAKPKHLEKYAKIYLDLGFDVATVSCSPWQLVWPTTGSQLIASDLLKFLEANEDQKPLVVHGFSVGAYVWAELLVLTLKDMKRYSPVLERVAAQVWDSPADVDEIKVGVPYAVFPNNKFMQNLIGSYIKTHLSLFYNIATQHYLRATAAYHCPPCRAPTLFLVSKVDVIGAEYRSRRAKDMMTDIGIKCNFKCWEDSPHIRHYNKYPEEYLAALYSHFEDAGLLRHNVIKENKQERKIQIN